MKTVTLCCAAATAASLFLIAGCQTVESPGWKLPPGVRTTSVNGYPLAYVERGSGPTVVLVHGALNDYRYWTPQLESLGSQFRVVSVSLRHYYPEPWNGKGRFSFKQHSDDLSAFIERVGGPVYLVGHSRAGPIVLITAHSRPDLVRKLVLADPALFSLLPGAAGAEDPRVTRAKRTQPYFERGDMEGGLRFFFDDVNGPGAWDKLPEAQRAVRRDNAWTIVGQLGDEELVSCADIGRLKMPVLLVGGEQSPKPFTAMREAARKCNPAARAIVVPKAGHQMNQHNPPAFNDAAARFLLD